MTPALMCMLKSAYDAIFKLMTPSVYKKCLLMIRISKNVLSKYILFNFAAIGEGFGDRKKNL